MTNQLTPEQIQKMRRSSALLPPPGGEVVGQLLDAYEEALQREAGLTEIASERFTYAVELEEQLSEARQLLRDAVEVLEAFLEIEEDDYADKWWFETVTPLLETLKVHTKEAEKGRDS